MPATVSNPEGTQDMANVHDAVDAILSNNTRNAAKGVSHAARPGDIPEDDEIAEEGQDALEAEAEESELETEGETEDSTSADPVVFKLDDGTPVKLSQAKSERLMHADYTRKTQSLAEDRKNATALFTEKLGQLEEAISRAEDMAGKEPEWSKLVNELDPWEYQKKKTAWEESQKAIGTQKAKAQELRSVQLHEATGHMLNTLMTNGFEPTWATQDGLLKGLSGVGEYARTYGYTVDQLKQMPDPRIFMILEKARRYDEGQTAVPAAKKQVQQAPKITKPGSTQTVPRTKAATVNNMEKRLRSSGLNPRDFASLMATKHGKR